MSKPLLKLLNVSVLSITCRVPIGLPPAPGVLEEIFLLVELVDGDCHLRQLRCEPVFFVGEAHEAGTPGKDERVLGRGVLCQLLDGLVGLDRFGGSGVKRFLGVTDLNRFSLPRKLDTKILKR